MSTLVAFGNDISSDVGERVKSLVLNLVVSTFNCNFRLLKKYIIQLQFYSVLQRKHFLSQSSNLSIEEFHHSLQDVTNFPLRPFVLPFLRAHLPLLQREIQAMARGNKQVILCTRHCVRHKKNFLLLFVLSPEFSLYQANVLHMFKAQHFWTIKN